MMKKNDAVAIGPYESCSMTVFIIAVRMFDTGHIFDVSLIQPNRLGATYRLPYNANFKHLFQLYVSLGETNLL